MNVTHHNHSPHILGSLRRASRATLAALLACSLTCTAATAAAAATAAQAWGAPGESTATGSTATAAAAGVQATQSPRYFLPNIGQSTPAKIQSPWGACWAFAVAGAVESSILKAQAQQAGAAQATLPAESAAFQPLTLTQLSATPDISERAIAWFAHVPQTLATGKDQAGEGFTLLQESTAEQLSGGNFAVAASALTARQTLLTEESAPYQYNGYTGNKRTIWYKSDKQFDATQQDWSLPVDLRQQENTGWRVRDVLRLQSPAKISNPSGTGTYEGYNQAATAAIKQALVNTGGVAVALEMEQSIPADVWQGNYTQAAPSKHLTYSTWAAYNGAMQITPNHAATIVGWDDAFDASNFAGSESGAPPANGAWLCKNSWGNDALYQALGGADDASRWGIVDGNGASSGYFWLSYYDHSISDVQAFTVEPTEGTPTTLYQHDFIGATEFATPDHYTGTVRTANVFTAEDTQLLKSVGAWTFAPNSSYAVSVYTVPFGIEVASADPNELMAQAKLMTQTQARFPDAGYHVTNLETPVLLTKGQPFILALTIYDDGEQTGEQASEQAGEQAGNTGNAGNPAGAGESAASFLGLEVAFSSTYVDGQTTKSVLVANPGETMVSTNGDTWMTLAAFNERHASELAQRGQQAPYTYGNALVKGMAAPTSMTGEGRVYECVPLSPIPPKNKTGQAQ